MGWLFRKRQGPKALPFQVRKVLQSRFSMDPRVMDRLRFVEKSEDMAGKQVRYFRIFDPDLVALAQRPVLTYEDLDTQREALCFQGRVEDDGSVYLADRRPPRRSRSVAATPRTA